MSSRRAAVPHAWRELAERMAGPQAEGGCRARRLENETVPRSRKQQPIVGLAENRGLGAFASSEDWIAIPWPAVADERNHALAEYGPTDTR